MNVNTKTRAEIVEGFEAEKAEGPEELVSTGDEKAPPLERDDVNLEKKKKKKKKK